MDGTVFRQKSEDSESVNSFKNAYDRYKVMDNRS